MKMPWSRKKRIPYDDMSQDARLHDVTRNVNVRAMGARDGAPLLYAVSNDGLSLIWQGKARYDTPLEAAIMAEAHYRNALRALLASTPEEVYEDWVSKDEPV